MSSTKKHNTTVSSSSLTSAELLTINSTDSVYSNNQQANVANNNKNERYQAVNNYNNYKSKKSENVPQQRTSEYRNYPQSYNQVNRKQQTSVINNLDNLSVNEPNETRSQKITRSQYPQYITENNNINNSSNFAYNNNNHNENYFSKNALLLDSNVVNDDRYSADRVALNMEIERRIRMNTARYVGDTNELSDNYSSASTYIRNQIFGETLRVVNEEGDLAQLPNNKFYTSRKEQMLQSDIREQFIKTKAEEKIRSEQAELERNRINEQGHQEHESTGWFHRKKTHTEQATETNNKIVKNEFTNHVEQKLMPKTVFIEPTSVVQELPKQEIKKQVFVQELPKTTLVQPKNAVQELPKQELNNQLSEKTLTPILNITNEQKKENFVKNFNNENGLNDDITSKQAISVDLNQNFYMSNEKLVDKQTSNSLNANNLNSLDENKKYIREDSLGYKIIEKDNGESNASQTSHEEKELLDNVEKNNLNKIQSLEEILKSLTNELLSVNKVEADTNKSNSPSQNNSTSNNESNLNNNQQANNQTTNTQNRAVNFMNRPANGINTMNNNSNQLNSNKVIDDFNNKKDNVNQINNDQVVDNFMNKKINFNPLNNNQNFQKMNDVQKHSTLNSNAFQSNNNLNKNDYNQLNSNKVIDDFNNKKDNVNQINNDQVVDNFMDKKINFNPLNNNQNFQKMNDVQKHSTLNSNAFQSNNNLNKNDYNQDVNYDTQKPLFNVGNKPSIKINPISEKPNIERHNSNNENTFSNYGSSPISSNNVHNESLDMISNDNLANAIDKNNNSNMRHNDSDIKKPGFPFSNKQK